MSSPTVCSLCARRISETVFELRNSPPVQNQLLGSIGDALAVKRERATYYYCKDCHFAFNPDFDRGAVDYARYYNEQTESATYRSYVDSVAKKLAQRCDLTPKSRILEIGC
jgi:hypothetical protein